MNRRIVLVGNPNVGKSVIFNFLTGRYVNVSNYPGTTVEVSKGSYRIAGQNYEIIDTPGLYSLTPLTEEEQVTRAMLFHTRPDLAVQVADAKNLRRMLNLTLELLDAGLPLILDINLIDEAEAVGMIIDYQLLSALLGIPVVATAAVKKIGLMNLKTAISARNGKPTQPPKYGNILENLISDISARLDDDYVISKRMMAMLLLQGDHTAQNLIKGENKYHDIINQIKNASKSFSRPMAYVIAEERQALVDDLISRAVKKVNKKSRKLAETIERLTREPWSGVPILLLILYFGLYKFVGGVGAGYLVDYINNRLFDEIIVPAVSLAANQYLSEEWMKSILIGDYGFFNMGIRYAVAIILPIVGTFFCFFAILEDCGYLPRLAMLMDGLFKKFGLNGRAVIPLTLGLGCGTMAVFVTSKT